MGYLSLILATTAGISMAVPNSTTTANSNTLRCWTNPFRVSHFSCSEAMRRACNVPTIWKSPGSPVFITKHYEDCVASVILPYEHPCDLTIFQKILDTCVPTATWIWQQGRGGSWNVQSDPSGSIPQVIVPMDESQAAYALYTGELSSRAKPHETLVAPYLV